MNSMIMNPGSGPVGDATLKNAHVNMEQFVKDLELDGVTFEHKAIRVDDGRYTFVVRRDGYETIVDMPGLPIEQVRYTKGANPWHFPRLYVDGSSWLWEFAVSSAREALQTFHEQRRDVHRKHDEFLKDLELKHNSFLEDLRIKRDAFELWYEDQKKRADSRLRSDLAEIDALERGEEI